MERKPARWWVGLLPPAWAGLQMLIGFQFFDGFSGGTPFWRMAFGVEAVATFILLLWGLQRIVGRSDLYKQRILWLMWSWIAVVYFAGRILEPIVCPRPDYFKLSMEAGRLAGDTWATRLMVFSMSQFALTALGIIVLAFWNRKKLAGATKQSVV